MVRQSYLFRVPVTHIPSQLAFYIGAGIVISGAKALNPAAAVSLIRRTR